MINVSHNADNRWTCNHIFRIFLIFLEKFGDYINLLLRLTDIIEFQSDLFCRIEINFLVHGHHLSLHEQLLNDHGRLHLHAVSKFTDGHLLRKCDGLDYIFIFLRLLWLLLRLLLATMLL